MIDTSLDSSNFYFLVAVLQGVILSGIILFRGSVRKPDVFLGLWIFLFSISLLHLVLEESVHAFNSKFPIPMDFGLAHGPLAYFHALSLIYPKRKFHWRQYLHFLPSVLLDGVLFTVFFLYVGSHEEWAYANVEYIQASALLLILLSLIQLATYTFLIYTEAKPVQSAPRDFPSIMKWFRLIVTCLLVILGFLIIAVPIALFNIELLDENSYLLYKPMGLITGLCIYGLGYLYLLKYRNQVNTYLDRISRARFSKEEILSKKTNLLVALKEGQLYLNETLSVSQLAEHLEWPINDVSQVINESLSTNFNDLINKYRIRAFKELVDQPEMKKYSILGLAQKAGFGSKASFYRAFKKETGVTPSEYLKSNHNQ